MTTKVEIGSTPKKRKLKQKEKENNFIEEESIKYCDDGDEEVFKIRRQQVVEAELKAEEEQNKPSGQEVDEISTQNLTQPSTPSVSTQPSTPSVSTQGTVQSIVEKPKTTTKEGVEIEKGFFLPSDTYYSLYEYQQTGVKWLWQLHVQLVGGYISH